MRKIVLFIICISSSVSACEKCDEVKCYLMIQQQFFSQQIYHADKKEKRIYLEGRLESIRGCLEFIDTLDDS